MRALVVDDLLSMRHFIASSLAETGDIEVDQAGDGAQAIRMLAEADYDLVLLDLTLPMVDGLAVLATLRQREKHPTPVLVVSARTDAASQRRVEELGAQYLAKPVKSQQLRDAVRAQLKLPEPIRLAGSPRAMPQRVTARFGDGPEEAMQVDTIDALGAFFVAEALQTVGARGVATLHFADSEAPLVVDCRVVHIRPEALEKELPRGFAVYFEPADAQLSNRLAHAFVDDTASQALIRSLAKITIFSDLDPEDFHILRTVVRAMVHAQGETIVREGDPADAFFIVERGSVKIIKGGDQELAVLGDGDFFGEMGVLMNAPRSANVVAMEETALYRIDKRDLVEFLRQHPRIAAKIKATMVKRFSENVSNVFADVAGG